MKKLLFTLAVIISLQTFAQDATTETEYNFVTKGYIDVLTKGTDMKAGYTVAEITTYTRSVYGDKVSFKFSRLLKDNKVRATMATLLVNEKPQKVLCIPLPESSKDLWELYTDDVQKLPFKQITLLAWGASYCLSHYVRK
jgi:hypothetical protein